MLQILPSQYKSEPYSQCLERYCLVDPLYYQDKVLVTILQNNDKKLHLFCCEESKEKERKANRFQQMKKQPNNCTILSE